MKSTISVSAILLVCCLSAFSAQTRLGDLNAGSAGVLSVSSESMTNTGNYFQFDTNGGSVYLTKNGHAVFTSTNGDRFIFGTNGLFYLTSTGTGFQYAKSNNTFSVLGGTGLTTVSNLLATGTISGSGSGLSNLIGEQLLGLTLWTNTTKIHYLLTNAVDGSWLGWIPNIGLVRSNTITGAASIVSGTNGGINVGSWTLPGAGNINATGTVSAASFAGSLAGATNLALTGLASPSTYGNLFVSPFTGKVEVMPRSAFWIVDPCCMNTAPNGALLSVTSGSYGTHSFYTNGSYWSRLYTFPTNTSGFAYLCYVYPAYINHACYMDAACFVSGGDITNCIAKIGWFPGITSSGINDAAGFIGRSDWSPNWIAVTSSNASTSYATSSIPWSNYICELTISAPSTNYAVFFTNGVVLATLSNLPIGRQTYQQATIGSLTATGTATAVNLFIGGTNGITVYHQ